MTPQKYQPPKPVGEPFHGDPADPAPFLTEGAPIAEPDGDTMTPWMDDSGFPSLQQAPPSLSTPHAPPVATEPPATPQFRPPPKPPRDPVAEQRQRVAKFGLASGIASLFIFWPLFGPIAIGLGIYSVRQGERRIGAWAISTGAAGILIGLVLTILVITGVVDFQQLINDLKNQK